ncbi:MAG: sodium/proline symporter [Deltaproteobacteria bacterium]|nr:sodium/proline symporter [Deltaproteobacteria bacterium]
MIAIFVTYLVLTLGLGIWQAFKTKSQSDFVLGGSKLPGWMLALSERATGESAWLLLGFTGFVYASGLSAIWIGVGCLLGICTAWIVLARRFRSEAERYGALTMPEYFSAKFPRKAATIRGLSTLIITFFFVFYVSAQFAGAGKTILETFGLDPLWGQIIAAAVILVYATFGGFMSVVAVDAFQSVLMIATLVVTPIVMLVMVAGGDGPGIGAALEAAGGGMDSLAGSATGFAAGLLVFNNLAWFFGYLGGQPQLNARFMGMRDERNVKIGRNIAVVWTVLAYAGVVGIGLCALALFGPGAVEDNEMILPHVLTELFPWWLAAILLAGAVAAMISTAQSMLLVAASSVSQDVYQGILKRGRAPDRTVLLVSRVATLAIGALGLVLALTTSELIYTIVSYAWAGIGCSFAPAILLSFYWERFSSAGVVTALVAGIVTTIVWITWPSLMRLIGLDSLAVDLEGTITARAVTFCVSIGLAVLVTLLTPTPMDEGVTEPAIRGSDTFT